MLSIRTLFSVNAYNVTLTGVAFLFLFTASQTASLASQNVLEAAAREGNGAASVGIGYISLALLYASLAICNWFAPVIVLLLGHKYAMFAGALSYVLFVAAFMEPQAWSLYSASLLNGLGAAVLWTAQGAFITACSDETNSNRHFSAFWTLFQMCQLVGGLYVYVSLSGISEITRSMRHQLFGGLIVCGSLGALMFFGLRDPAIKTRVVRQSELPSSSSSSSSSTADQSDTVDLVTMPLLNKRSGIREQFAVSIHTFCRSFTLLRSKVMLAILVASGFTGVNATFQSSLFATCIGHTLAFGSQAKSYMGLVGIFIGVGEIAGSSLMHLRPWIPTTGLITLFGYATALFGAFFCLLMLPPDSPMRDSDQLTYIQPNVLTCILVSVLFGMVDSVWYTQISVLIGHVYRSHEADVPVAFALFLCAQAILAAVTFAYCGSVLLHWHILLYVLWATAGLACFCYAQWTHLQLVHRPRLLVEHEA